MQRTGIIQAEHFGVAKAKTLPQGTPFSLLGPLGHCPARTAVTVELCCMQMRWAGQGSSCCTMAPCLLASCRKHMLYECKGDCTLTDYYLEELKAGWLPPACSSMSQMASSSSPARTVVHTGYSCLHNSRHETFHFEKK